MAFTRQGAVTPVAIGNVEVELFSPAAGSEETAGASYRAQVVYSNGEVRMVGGNLVPHLTTAQINALLSFMAAMRTKAEQEILP